MIGFYDYTIVLTILSLVSSVVGMTQAMQDHFRMAVILLAVCGVLDAFDGKVARTKKNRTDAQKLYGIQLDSLVDIVSFGIFPAMICYLMGMREVYDIVILVLYAICGVIRLAYFNVLETKRQMDPDGGEKVYHGLPITTISMMLPLVFLVSFIVPQFVFVMILRIVMLGFAVLYVLDIKVKKLKSWQIILVVIIGSIAALAMLLFSKYKLPKEDPAPEEPLVEIDCDQWA